MSGDSSGLKKMETWFISTAIALSVGLLLLNSFFLKTHWPKQAQAPWWSVVGDVSTAILTASLVAAAQRLVRDCLRRKEQRPFEQFWGQHFGASPGRIILQSDHLRHMTDLLTQDLSTNLANKISGSPSLPEDFSTDLDSLLETQVSDGTGESSYKYGAQRVFKARNWLNRCDVEGARNIREAFTDRGFKPPDFVTSERDGTTPHDPNAPFEIYMGLGFTVGIKDHVNTSCQGFLSIQSTDKGDAISLLDSLARNARKELSHLTLKTDHDSKSEEEGTSSIFYPKDWNLHSYAAGEKLNDYAYILRDVRLLDRPHLGKCQVVFHVAGFTEQGTWAAGHYLRHRWDKLFTEHVEKGLKHGGRFVILLKGQSPFSEPKDGTHLWKELEVIKHEESHPDWLNPTWNTELSTLIRKHLSKA